MNNQKMIAAALKRSAMSLLIAATQSTGVYANTEYVDTETQSRLDEIIVTAQKRRQSLQETPIAISVMNAKQLQLQGINNLAAFARGAIPSLHMIPLGNSASNVAFGIRGNAPRDTGEITREASVGVYLDGVYMARSQGLDMELVDLQRIEVLRGPQGSLFGRNAVGGAVSLVSKKPSGQFGFNQTLSMGRFNELRSVTRIDFDEFSGVKAKLDYIHAERDGWVNNTAPGEADYTEYQKDGGRFSLNWQANQQLMVDYSYDKSDVETTQNYYQLHIDRIGVFGEEPKRLTESRQPATPLTPTIVEQQGHALTLSWQYSDDLIIKSISAYRDLQEDNDNNYNGVVYFNGFSETSVLDQDQFSQELQLIGTTDQFEWVAGAYYLKEEVDKTLVSRFTLDIFGNFGPPLTTITPPITQTPRVVNAEAESQAIYGQLTWALNEQFDLTLGVRYTEDQRFATRSETTLQTSDQKSDHVDGKVTLNYHWTDDLATYVQWSTAYKAGGVNTRSASFTPFNEEEAQTFEIGLKSEFWQQRARLNMALFSSDYSDLQLDFSDPEQVGVVETINISKPVEVRGLELELTVAPIANLVVAVSYSYLDNQMPLQNSPFDGSPTQFFVSLAPQHAGAVTLDYQFPTTDYGMLSAHLDVTSTDHFSFAPFGEQRFDAYSLINGRLTLREINLGNHSGSLTASLWGRNLTDEEYIVDAFPVGDPAVTIANAYGDPRTMGIEVRYDF